MYYIRVYCSTFQRFFQRLCYGDIVNAPAFILRPYCRESRAPPCIVMRIGVELTKCVDKPFGPELVEPGSFFWQKAAGLFITYGVMYVYFFICNIIVAAYHQVRPFLPQPY